MVWKVVSVALMAAAGMAGVAGAQGRGPAEQPPAGFAGQQYVDSRGCVFLRAGHGGQVNWVQRVNLDRKPLCGYPPTAQLMAQANRELAQASAAAAPAAGLSAAPAAAPARAPSPAPAPTVAASGTAPMATVATTTTAPRISAPAPRTVIPASQYAAPRVAAVQGTPAPAASAAAPAVLMQTPARTPSPAPAPTVFVTENDRAHAAPAAPAALAPAALAPVAAPALRQLGTALGMAAVSTACPADAPYGQTYDLVGGGQVIVCTASGQRLTGLRPGDTPIPAYGGGRYAHADHRVAGGLVYDGARAGAETFAVPKGYRAAWTDDRLNPVRAVGTATGAASMRQVWSDDVPQQDLRDAARQGKTVKRVSVSSKAAVAPRAVAGVAGARFVQVGSFAVPENATRAAQRLQSMGLPVQISRAKLKGKPVQVVRAGPFASPEAAQSALSAARQAGFSDALLRR